MVEYVKTLLPRLQQFSKGLNDTAIFAEIPWAFIDDDGDKVTYIFRRNNDLLVSKRGDVTTGHWEYLPVVQSLLIEHAGRKRMYNQGFVDNVVMALRKDGTDELFLLANQNVLPELDAIDYLKQKANGTLEQKLTYTVKVEFMQPKKAAYIQSRSEKYIFYIGNPVFEMDGISELKDGAYLSKSNFKIEVKNGKIISVKQGLPDWMSLFYIALIIIVLAVVLRSISYQ